MFYIYLAADDIRREYDTQSLRNFDQRSDTSRSSYRDREDAMSDSRSYLYSRADDALAQSGAGGYRRSDHGLRSQSLGREELLNGDRSLTSLPSDTNRQSARASLSPSRSRMGKIGIHLIFVVVICDMIINVH